jgi:serine/threonine protein kinase
MRINPCNMTEYQQGILSEFIRQNPQQSIFEKDTSYQVSFAELNGIKNVNLKFSLSHTLLKRERIARNPDKSGIRFEIKSNEVLGKGQFGAVYEVFTLVLDEKKGTFSATVKQKPRVVKIQKAREGYTESVLNQKVPYLHSKRIIFSDKKKSNNFYVATVSAQMPGKNLADILNTEKLTTEQKLQLSLALLKAVKSQVHENGLVHRDLKPANVMVYFKPESRIPEVNIIDFGLAKLKEGDAIGACYGSFCYMAPEVAQRKGSYPASDIYSLSKLFCELFLQGIPLFLEEEKDLMDDLLCDIKKGRPLSEAAVDWLADLWVDNSELFKNSNLSLLHKLQFKNIIKDMSCVDPSKRISLDVAITRLSKICEQRADATTALLRRKAEIKAKVQMETQAKRKEKIEKLRLKLLDLKKQLPIYYILSHFPSIFSVNRTFIESDERRIDLFLNELDRKPDLEVIEHETVQIRRAWHTIQKNNNSNNFKFIFNYLIQRCVSENTGNSSDVLKNRKEINYIRTHMAEFINLQRNNRSHFFARRCKATLNDKDVSVLTPRLIRC